jgi:glyoxalase family protein
MADRLLFLDPDGLALELVIDDGEDEPLLARAAGVDGHVAIRGIHGVRGYSSDPARCALVLGGLLGMSPVGGGSWLARGERRHALVICDGPPEEPGRVGAGTMHHVAFTIRDGTEQRWRDRVDAAGLRPTPVMDRQSNKSFYFREPSRVLFELTTDQPGFVSEPADRLGESLMLAGDLESRRAELEQRFPPLPNPRRRQARPECDALTRTADLARRRPRRPASNAVASDELDARDEHNQRRK